VQAYHQPTKILAHTWMCYCPHHCRTRMDPVASLKLLGFQFLAHFSSLHMETVVWKRSFRAIKYSLGELHDQRKLRSSDFLHFIRYTFCRREDDPPRFLLVTNHRRWKRLRTSKLQNRRSSMGSVAVPRDSRVSIKDYSQKETKANTIEMGQRRASWRLRWTHHFLR